MQNVLCDTCFWYGLFDPRDQYYETAVSKAEQLDSLRIVLPWPILYETLRTQFVKNGPALARFEAYFRRPHITYLDDQFYRDDALRVALESSLHRSRPLSLIDSLIRLILDDTNTKIDYLVTFNEKDFSDVCGRQRVLIL